MSIENTVVVEITMSAVKTVVVIFRGKFGVKQHDKILCKQQSLGLRLKKLFPNEDIIEECFALHCRTDFTFKKHMLAAETDGKGHADRDPDYEKEDKKIQKNLVTTLLELILIKKGFNDYEEFGRVSAYITESIKNKLKNQLENH